MCLDYGSVTREFLPTAQIDVGVETVGQFSTHYFSENGRRIPVIIQISINVSVKLLGIPGDAWGCGLTFIENVQGPTMPSGWGDADTSNQNWRVTLWRPYGNVTVSWVITVPTHPSYMTWSP